MFWIVTWQHRCKIKHLCCFNHRSNNWIWKIISEKYTQEAITRVEY